VIGGDGRVRAAYGVAVAIERELDGTLPAWDAGEIVVVEGRYDRAEDVLALAGIPHRLIAARTLAVGGLPPDGTLVVNCASLPLLGHAQELRAWVAEGGTLLTADWALDLTVACFPGVIRRMPGRSTADEVVRLAVADPDNPLVSDLFVDDRPPRWRIEAASAPFEVTEGVQVLLRGEGMRPRYGSDLVAVSFRWYRGRVLHTLTHFVQRTALPPLQDRAGARDLVAAVLGPQAARALAAWRPDLARALDVATAEEVRAAYAGYRLTTAVLRAARGGGPR
jgi:hypothetical protein